MAALPKMIPLADAVKKVRGATIDDLRLLVDKGKIKGASINGEIFVDTKTLPEKVVRKEDLPEYKKFKHLKNSSIWISKAERVYEVNASTILNWIKKGYISKEGTKGNRVLLNEQDVAYCAFFYHKYDSRQGQWMFDMNGVPRLNERSVRRKQAIPASAD